MFQVPKTKEKKIGEKESNKTRKNIIALLLNTLQITHLAPNAYLEALKG